MAKRIMWSQDVRRRVMMSPTVEQLWTGLVESTQATWSAVLDESSEVHHAVEIEDAGSQTAWITATIHVTGDWCATIDLSAPIPLARIWTARMFGVSAAECSSWSPGMRAPASARALCAERCS